MVIIFTAFLVAIMNLPSLDERVAPMEIAGRKVEKVVKAVSLRP